MLFLSTLQRIGRAYGCLCQLFRCCPCSNSCFLFCTSTVPLVSKPLSAKRERECLQRIQQGILRQKRAYRAQPAPRCAYYQKILFQHARPRGFDFHRTIGLIKAAASFDYEKGTRFATYASRCIENAILSMRLIKNRPARGLRVRAVFCFSRGFARVSPAVLHGFCFRFPGSRAFCLNPPPRPIFSWAALRPRSPGTPRSPPPGSRLLPAGR